MKVTSMTSKKTGNAVANQFRVYGDNGEVFFQSYTSVIAKRSINKYTNREIIELDPVYWNYSKTTGKYRTQFLGESTKETQAKIDSGEYVLANLN